MTQPVLCAATHRITAGVNAFYRLTVSSSAPLRAQQRYLDVVQAWLCNDITDWVDDETVCQALSNLLGLDVYQTCEHLGAFVGPMLLWSTTKPWGTDVQQARAFSTLCNQHFVRQSRTQPYDTCIAALDSIQQWLPLLPIELQQDILVHAVQDTNTKIDWASRRASGPAQREDEWTIAAKLARLIAHYPQQLCNARDTVSDLWLRAMNEYATSSLTMNGQLAWAKALLASSEMPITSKLHILASLVPEIWLDAEIQPEAILPLDEHERFFWMPWAIVRSPTWTRVLSDANPEDTNHAMLRRFCPNAERIIGCVARPHEWKDHRIIGALMQDLRHAGPNESVLPLPADLL